MSKKPEKLPTKERILEVSERLFAEKGLDGTSMRHITEAAGVNLASVNYHFGSKEGLIAAVFHRHLAPLNAARLVMLHEVELEAGSRPPKLEAVLEAFIRPAVVRAQDPRHSEAFMRLMGRCLSEPPAYAEKYIHPHFKDLVSRFQAAVKRALPDLSYDAIYWRMNFVVGALHHALHLWSKWDRMPFKPEKPLDAEELIGQLIGFAAAGLRSHVANHYGRSLWQTTGPGQENTTPLHGESPGAPPPRSLAVRHP